MNGWDSYENWNRALWINNEESIYRDAVRFMRRYYKNMPYRDFISHMGWTHSKTPDGVPWVEPIMYDDELDDMMRELVDDGDSEAESNSEEDEEEEA